MEAENANVI